MPEIQTNVEWTQQKNIKETISTENAILQWEKRSKDIVEIKKMENNDLIDQEILEEQRKFNKEKWLNWDVEYLLMFPIWWAEIWLDASTFNKFKEISKVMNEANIQIESAKSILWNSRSNYTNIYVLTGWVEIIVDFKNNRTDEKEVLQQLYDKLNVKENTKEEVNIDLNTLPENTKEEIVAKYKEVLKQLEKLWWKDLLLPDVRNAMRFHPDPWNESYNNLSEIQILLYKKNELTEKYHSL
jgi:hypothetical protein